MDKDLEHALPGPPSKDDFSDFSKWLAGAPLPNSRSEFDDLVGRLNLRLDYDFVQQEKGAGREIQSDSCDGAGRKAILDSLDEYIFDSIQEYGPFVLLDYQIVRRICAWQFDRSCIKKLHRLGDELAKAARIRYGLAKGRISRKHVRAKKHLVPELEGLRTKLIEVWPKDKGGIIAFIEKELRLPDSPYPNLAINAMPLLDFLTKHPDVAVGFRGMINSGHGRTVGRSADVTPVQLYVSLVAYSENRSEESVRQDLYRLQST